MAGLDADTSSYPKPQAPTNFLDTAGKYQALESNKIGIDQSKLKLMNDRWGMINKELSTLVNDPDVESGSPNAASKVIGRIGYFGKLAELPDEMIKSIVSSVPTDPRQIKSFVENSLARGNENNAAMNFHYGVPGTINNGQQTQPTITSPRFGSKPIGGPIQNQPPPTTPVINEANEPTLLGPRNVVIPPGQQQVPGGIPGQMQPAGQPLPVGPINNPSINGPSANFGGNVTGATVGPNLAQNKLPVTPPAGLYRTGQAPGVAEAATTAGKASGEQLSNDRVGAASYQREIFPLVQAIPLLEKLGTKGTGPGTETFNAIKSFALSNIPGVKESDFGDTVLEYDKVKKYLTDFVNQTGSSGTNDKLAASFAGNPSVHISNAAATDVAKAALALRRMKQAQVVEFEKSGLPESKYSQFALRWGNDIDPRAFGIDQYSPEAKAKLFKELSNNPKAKDRFEKTLKIAQEAELIPKLGQ